MTFQYDNPLPEPKSSPGNPNSNGRGCERVCERANPKSKAYKKCGCDNVVPIASNFGIVFLLIVAIVLIAFKIKK